MNVYVHTCRDAALLALLACLPACLHLERVAKEPRRAMLFRFDPFVW